MDRIWEGLGRFARRIPGALHSFVQPGLRRELVLTITAATMFCTAIVFFVLYRSTDSNLHTQLNQEVEQDEKYFGAAIGRSHAASPGELAVVAAQYFKDHTFAGESEVLIARIVGVAPLSSDPELTASGTRAVALHDGHIIEQDRQAATLLHLRASPQLRTVDTLQTGQLVLDTKHLATVEGLAVIVSAGQPLGPVTRAENSLARAFLLAGLLALGVAVIAAALIATRLTRPLRRMAGVAAQVEGGDLEPRMQSSANDGVEFKVLTESFNRMLDRLEEAFDQQREFTADASHELRTPLTVIRGQLEVLAAQPKPSRAEVLRTEQTVQAEIARVNRLVTDLLLLAKSEQPEFLQPQTFDVDPFVREVWEASEFIGERNFELAEVPAGVLRADPDRLAQALRNLIANAVNHTAAPDGLIRLTVASSGGGRLLFTVDDDGPGIPDDELERVFERFHRTDASRTRLSGGTGLGLAIVRAIAEGHGGTVRAARSPEGGARFELELPGFVPALAPRRVPTLR